MSETNTMKVKGVLTTSVKGLTILYDMQSGDGHPSMSLEFLVNGMFVHETREYGYGDTPYDSSAFRLMAEIARGAHGIELPTESDVERVARQERNRVANEEYAERVRLREAEKAAEEAAARAAAEDALASAR